MQMCICVPRYNQYVLTCHDFLVLVQSWGIRHSDRIL